MQYMKTRGYMKRQLTTLLILVLIFGSLIWIIDISSENAKAGSSKSGIIVSDETWTLAKSPYWIEGDITIPIDSTLIIEPGVEVRFNGYYSILIDGNLICEGLEANGITITSNYTDPAPGDWNRILTNPSGHIELKNSIIRYGEVGVYISGSSNNIIENNVISLNDAIGLGLDESSYNTIMNNNVSSNHFGIYLSYSSKNTIKNNRISHNRRARSLDPPGFGLELTLSSNNTIVNNYIESNDVKGIELYTSHDNMITNNDVLNNEYGFALYSSLRNSLNDNNFSLNDYGAYLALSSHKNTISKNTISSNLVGGIKLDISSNNISDNQISNNGYGIYIGSSSNINITNNYIQSNDLDGIEVYHSSNNTIKGNNISWNKNGISLWSSGGNVIVRNNVLSNDEYGINLHSSSGNSIYHNNIINNVNQAYDDTISNDWNDTYPSGGNFWSDYSPTCKDAMKGSGQDMEGIDGICDEEYDIDSDSKDYYPLKPDTIMPIAKAGRDQFVPKGFIIILNGSDSTDNVGISNYTWQITKNGILIDTLYGATHSYRFEYIGTYVITLTVRDYAGNTDTNSITIIVTDFTSKHWWRQIFLILITLGVLILYIWNIRMKK